jgi:hypothetical protein
MAHDMRIHVRSASNRGDNFAVEQLPIQLAGYGVRNASAAAAEFS